MTLYGVCLPMLSRSQTRQNFLSLPIKSGDHHLYLANPSPSFERVLCVSMEVSAQIGFVVRTAMQDLPRYQ
jgi:hypothetical protein